jgi:hypothetical protein
LRVETLSSIWFMAHAPSQSSAKACSQLGSTISFPPGPRARWALDVGPARPIRHAGVTRRQLLDELEELMLSCHQAVRVGDCAAAARLPYAVLHDFECRVIAAPPMQFDPQLPTAPLVAIRSNTS